MTEQSTRAGWYPDPQQTGTQRYWDGERWTEQVAPMPEARGATNAAASVFLLLCAVGVVVLLILVAGALVT